MNETQAVSPSDLVEGTPPPPKPLSWTFPDGSPVRIRPYFPGATYGWHPIGKRCVSFKDVPAENLDATGEPFKPGRPQSFIPPPAPQPAPPPAPEPAPVTPSPQPDPGAAQSPPPPPADEPPPPDFSDLPPSDDGQQQQQQQQQTDPESNRSLAKTLWVMFIALMSSIFGREWQPTSAEEQDNVISKIAAAFDYWALRALDPVEQMWMAIGAYCFPRWLTVVRWWRARVAAKFRRDDPVNAAKQAKPAPEAEPEKNSPKPESGKIHPKGDEIPESEFVG